VMTPTAQAAAIASLQRHENNILKVYDDADGKPIVPGKLVQGIPTIGVGRNLVKGITTAESLFLFSNDRADVERSLDLLAPWWSGFNDARQVAMVELGFNLGVERMKSIWPRTWMLLQAGQFTAAANEIRSDKVWMGQVKSRGDWITNLIETGVLV
jgi:GH24 family phage-related lysozyme (muramidase)